MSLEGSVCSGCYALKGAYTWPTAKAANERRLKTAHHPEWVEAMSFLVRWQARENGTPYFRWFDSGDLQDKKMLEQIVAVANRTPMISHWLPTREYTLIRTYQQHTPFPDNLTVRLSAHLIDHPPPKTSLPTSTVHHQNPPTGYPCPAYTDQPASCDTCRACWNPTIKNISYPHH